MKRSGLVSFAATAAFVLASIAVRADSPTPLRWSRPLAADAGWSRVELPDDVVAACRPGFPDLRLRGSNGAEVPWVRQDAIAGPAPRALPLIDVETTAGRETTAVVDRGVHSVASATATLELDADEFLKPVIVEASDDAHDWKEIARGSIFAAASSPGAKMTTLRFAPNDRRYWRIRLDDRNSPPVTPLRLIDQGPKTSTAPLRSLLLTLTRGAPGDGETTYEGTLPSANLAVTSIVLAPTDAVFSRRVTVSEQVLFRDEITNRVVGGGMIWRGPSGESLSIPLGPIRGPLLSVEIDDGGSPPLTIPGGTVLVAPQAILFHADAPSLPLTMEYGSALLAAPRYDLAAALSNGPPEPLAVATPGVAVDHVPTAPLGAPPHGAIVDESHWATRATVDLPAGGGGGVAWLALEGVDAERGIRLVDGASHEVPYLFDRSAHRAHALVAPIVAEAAGRTTVTLASLAALHEIDAVELTASAPDYFQREVTVVEVTRDARGPTGERELGRASWERRPGEPARPLRIAVSAPSQTSVDVRIENRDNAPLTLGPVTVERTVRRVDFVYAAGDSLSLLAGNPSAGLPSYDLALLSGPLLALPARAARLEPARDIAPVRPGVPPWFWGVVIAAGLAVGAMLARALRTPVKATAATAAGTPDGPKGETKT